MTLMEKKMWFLRGIVLGIAVGACPQWALTEVLKVAGLH